MIERAQSTNNMLPLVRLRVSSISLLLILTIATTVCLVLVKFHSCMCIALSLAVAFSCYNEMLKSHTFSLIFLKSRNTFLIMKAGRCSNNHQSVGPQIVAKIRLRNGHSTAD